MHVTRMGFALRSLDGDHAGMENTTTGNAQSIDDEIALMRWKLSSSRRLSAERRAPEVPPVLNEQSLENQSPRKGWEVVPLHTLVAIPCSGRLLVVSLAEVNGRSADQTRIGLIESFELAGKILAWGVRQAIRGQAI